MSIDERSEVTDQGTSELLVDQTPVDADQDGPLLLEELLVEEVSIDGMCGVY